VRRTLTAGVLALLFTLSFAGIVTANATASIDPLSQTHNHGVASNWTLTWSGTAPFRTVCFYYDSSTGEGWCLGNTYAVGATTHRTFWPCVTKTYTQALNVTDWANSFDTAGSTAKEYGGTPC
jgi:hypothetical protein